MKKEKVPERMTSLPLRVQLALGTWRYAKNTVYRVACFDAGSCSRDAAWKAARIYGKSIGVNEEYKYTGWRKVHVHGYYVWWAQDLNPLAALAAVAHELENKKARRAKRKEQRR